MRYIILVYHIPICDLNRCFIFISVILRIYLSIGGLHGAHKHKSKETIAESESISYCP